MALLLWNKRRFTRIRPLAGGFEAWKRLGYAVETRLSAPPTRSA